MSEVATTSRRTLANPWLLLPVAFFVALAGLFLVRIGRDPALVPSPLIGREAPSFVLAPLQGLTRDGEPVAGFSYADLKSSGGTLLNVFASWCVPCREEHPVLMQLAQEKLAQEKGVTLLGLNHKDESENARRFLGGLGNPYAKVGVDPSGRTSLDFGVYGVPETFAIDPEGRIVAKHVGPLTMADAQELLRKAAGSR